MGITCALCHSTVDDSVMPGIGKRLDGRPNLDPQPRARSSRSRPRSTRAKKAVYNSWGPGKYDPRFNQDGKNGPVVIPPAFGLAGRPAGDLHRRRRHHVLEQLRRGDPDGRPRRTSRSRGWAIAVEAKGAGPGQAQAARAAGVPAQPGQARRRPRAASTPRRPGAGRRVFAGAASCASCHAGAAFTDEKLHAPAETGMDPAYAETERHQEVPRDAAARPVAAPALLPRRQARRPGRGGGPLRHDPQAEAERRAEEGPRRVPEVDLGLRSRRAQRGLAARSSSRQARNPPRFRITAVSFRRGGGRRPRRRWGQHRGPPPPPRSKCRSSRRRPAA